MRRKLLQFSMVVCLFILCGLTFPFKVNAASKEVTVELGGHDVNDSEKSLAQMINKERRQAGIPELKTNVMLREMALQRAVEISIYPDHFRTDGSEFTSVLDEFGVIECGLVGEALAIGYEKPEDVLQAWMNSDNKDIILEKEFDYFGVACFEKGSTDSWVAFFLKSPVFDKYVEDDLAYGQENVRVEYISRRYRLDIELIESVSIQFALSGIRVELGEKVPWKLELYGAGLTNLGVIVDGEIEFEIPSIMKYVYEDGKRYFQIERGGKEGEYEVIVKIGDLNASKIYDVVCPHHEEFRREEDTVISSSCLKPSIYTYYCENCEKKCKEALDYGEHVISGTPLPGRENHCYICSVCSSTIVTDEKHTFEWKIEKPATENQVGLKYRECSGCNEIRDKGTPIKNVTRIFGNHRYETALKTADYYKEQLNVAQFNAVVIASGTNFADALSGSSLAIQKNAPILLTNGQDVVIKMVQTYIMENVKKGGTIYILGGTNAVPEKIEYALEDFRIVRLGGADRYETNLKILKEGKITGGDLMVATGRDFADSLAVAVMGKPILLVDKKLSKKQIEFLENNTWDTVYIIGGYNAVSEHMKSAVAVYSKAKMRRISGENRYDTAVEIQVEFNPNANRFAIAYAWNFPDGLCAAPVVHHMNAPLLLTADIKSHYGAIRIKDILHVSNVEEGLVFGGPALFGEEFVDSNFGIEELDQVIVY